MTNKLVLIKNSSRPETNKLTPSRDSAGCRLEVFPIANSDDYIVSFASDMRVWNTLRTLARRSRTAIREIEADLG